MQIDFYNERTGQETPGAWLEVRQIVHSQTTAAIHYDIWANLAAKDAGRVPFMSAVANCVDVPERPAPPVPPDDLDEVDPLEVLMLPAENHFTDHFRADVLAKDGNHPYAAAEAWLAAHRPWEERDTLNPTDALQAQARTLRQQKVTNRE